MGHKDPERRREYQAEYRARNKERIAETMSEWKAANKAQYDRARKEWAQSEKGKLANRVCRLRSDGVEVTGAELRELILAHNWCQICWRALEVSQRCVDHCHDTKKIRGILCRMCNAWLGRIGDDPALADRAGAYLRGEL